MKERVFTKFIDGIRWNFIESVVYRVILLMHHLFLFKVLDGDLYGYIGTIFSSLYLAVALANFGLDHSIGIFYATSTKSKQHFKRLFTPHLWGQVYIFTIIACLFIGGCVWSPFRHRLLSLGLPLTSIIALALLSEGMKKTFRSLLQYAFLNKITSTIEIVYLLFYVLTIWGSYEWGIQLSVFVICSVFVGMSLLSTGLLALYLYNWYQLLPDNTEGTFPLHTNKRFLQSRILNTINNIGRNLFTNNFLVALFAYKYGLQQAAIIKIVGTISGTVSATIYKTFGRTSNALLAHSKQLDNVGKQKTFSLLTYTIHQGVYCSVISLAITYPYITSIAKKSDPSLGGMAIFVLLIIPLVEHLFIAYERFYITEEKTHYLVGFNLIAAACLILLIQSSFSPSLLITGLLGIRLLIFLLMSTVAYNHWNIKPNWTVQPKLLGGTMVIAGIFFVLARYLGSSQCLDRFF